MGGLLFEGASIRGGPLFERVRYVCILGMLVCHVTTAYGTIPSNPPPFLCRCVHMCLESEACDFMLRTTRSIVSFRTVSAAKYQIFHLAKYSVGGSSNSFVGIHVLFHCYRHRLQTHTSKIVSVHEKEMAPCNPARSRWERCTAQ